MHASTSYDPSPTPPGPLPAIKTPLPGSLPTLPPRPMHRLERLVEEARATRRLMENTRRLRALNDADEDARGA
jgi:hypothetical protein